jgi:hypothetical protein
MTRTPSPPSDDTAAVAENGITTDGARAPVLDIDDVTKT